jgi:hypothetical protein
MSDPRCMTGGMVNAPRAPTRAEYDKLKPYEQGYVTYMRASWPGARLPKRNPYPKGSKKAAEWTRGTLAAVLDVVDTQED